MTRLYESPYDGYNTTVLLDEIDDPAAPKVGEVTGAGVHDVALYFDKHGFNFQTSQAKLTRSPDPVDYDIEAPGRKSYTLDITGIDNTNVEATIGEPAPNLLADVLGEGKRLYAVRRLGKAWDEPFAAGDVVTVIRFRVGVRAEVSADFIHSKWQCFVEAVFDKVVLAA
jgi:hypothetical protein